MFVKMGWPSDSKQEFLLVDFSGLPCNHQEALATEERIFNLFPFELPNLSNFSSPEMSLPPKKTSRNIAPIFLHMSVGSMCSGQRRQPRSSWIVVLLRESFPKCPKHSGLGFIINFPDWLKRTIVFSWSLDIQGPPAEKVSFGAPKYLLQAEIVRLGCRTSSWWEETHWFEGGKDGFKKGSYWVKKEAVFFGFQE